MMKRLLLTAAAVAVFALALTLDIHRQKPPVIDERAAQVPPVNYVVHQMMPQAPAPVLPPRDITMQQAFNEALALAPQKNPAAITYVPKVFVRNTYTGQP